MPKIKYKEFNFRDSTLRLIDQANQIIAEYLRQGFDLTLRQLYYQFVARDIIPNTMKSYKNLGSIVNDARLAGMIDWETIVDRTRDLRSLSHWDDPSDIVSACASQFNVDKWAEQPYRPEVWIEKDALVGVFERVCQQLDVPLLSCRGYTSQSEMWGAAQRMLSHRRKGQTPIIFHFGDHDPSGKDMSRDIQDRLELFTGRMIRFERLALNMDQVKEYDPPPNPAKITDSRAEGYIAEFGDESWELDALEPRLLDLFCCAGGAGLGYRRAGFEVVGVDIQPQPKYPFEFVQSDAIEFLLRHGREFDAIHASPPCQAYSMSSKQFRLQGKKYVDLVSPTRNALKRVGKPWIIENVPGSPLINPIMLCGAMFGLQTYRHRLFEASFLLKVPNHPEHKARNAKMGRPVEDGEFIQIAGHFSDVPFARKAMGIDWMGQKELAQAIPPAYTEYLGKQLYERIKR